MMSLITQRLLSWLAKDVAMAGGRRRVRRDGTGTAGCPDVLIGGLLLLAGFPLRVEGAPPVTYPDGRPQASLRMEAQDHGRILRHGAGPGHCDRYGMREALIYEASRVFYLHYDGAGPEGWKACLAVSSNLIDWALQGPILDLSPPGSPDSAAACSPWVIRAGDWWHMFYLGTPNASPPPERVPAFPYLTLKARSRQPGGPWEKQRDIIPFTVKANTFYSATASPGHIVKQGGEYLMFFSGSTPYPDVKRTLGIARTRDLDSAWDIQPEPIVPLSEQIENSSLYYEPENRMWFLFTNHIGVNEGGVEFTDAVWVYWSPSLETWDARNKAVVLDGRNCTWSTECIGMPSVTRVGDRLAIFYDAPGGSSLSHVNRDLGLAWLDLPLAAPSANDH
jgi:predicted GH43/DUF377 family glycosyl hydrolase